MEELLQLRQLIEQQQYDQALALVDELEEMSKEDKLNKIYSYAVILLLHLIKQAAENRSTRSWEFSIYNASKQIKRVNKRRKSGGHYATDEELREIFDDAFETALKKAALEAFEGIYTEKNLRKRIKTNAIIQEGLNSVTN